MNLLRAIILQLLLLGPSLFYSFFYPQTCFARKLTILIIFVKKKNYFNYNKKKNKFPLGLALLLLSRNGHSLLETRIFRTSEISNIGGGGIYILSLYS